SHAVASSQPPPNAFPCNKQIVGTGNEANLYNMSRIGVKCSNASSSPKSPCNSVKSPPAQKLRSPALLITKNFGGFCTKSSNNSLIRLAIANEIAFRLSALFNQMLPYPSAANSYTILFSTYISPLCIHLYHLSFTFYHVKVSAFNKMNKNKKQTTL